MGDVLDIYKKNKRSVFRLSFAFVTAFFLILLFQNCGKDFEVSLIQNNTEASTDGPATPPPPSLDCSAGFHRDNGICVSDRRACPIANGTGEQIWNGTSYGACTVVSCNPNYRNQSNTCVFSPSSCPVSNGNGELQADGTCRLISCNSGFHQNGAMCESDQRSCSITNGQGRQTWTGTAFGPCQVVSCNTSFHVEGNTCVSNTQLCTIANGAGMRTWNGTSYGACMVTACNAGYTSTGSLCVPATTGGSFAWTARSSTRFMLSGHSLTDDPLASYIVDVAVKRNDSVAYNQQIVIGSPIRVRTRGGGSTGWSGYTQGKNRDGSTGLNIISELRNPQTIGTNQRYDTLVITENHNSLDMIQWEDTIGYLRHYHDRLIEGNASGRTFFYNSWLDINKSNPTLWIDHEKKAMIAWECVASKVNHSLESARRNDRVINLPTGAALVDLVERIVDNQVTGISGTTTQKLNMIFSDNVHLTRLGVYYMSLVTYAAIYGKTPAGVTPPEGSNISPATASQLQSIAWNFINTYYSQTHPGVRDMAYCRSYIQQQVCSSYHTLKGNPGAVSGCQDFFGNSTSSPFRWPDSSFIPYPAP